MWKDVIIGLKYCSLSVTPYTTINRDKNGGSIPAGGYCLFIWKSSDDGWNLSGQGNFETP